MSETSTVYVKVVVSYGEPTKLDDVGCDGIFIDSAEICTKEVAALLRVARAAKEALEEIIYWHADMLTEEERNHPRGSGWARVHDNLTGALKEVERLL